MSRTTKLAFAVFALLMIRRTRSFSMPTQLRVRAHCWLVLGRQTPSTSSVQATRTLARSKVLSDVDYSKRTTKPQPIDKSARTRTIFGSKCLVNYSNLIHNSTYASPTLDLVRVDVLFPKQLIPRIAVVWWATQPRAGGFGSFSLVSLQRLEWRPANQSSYWFSFSNFNQKKQDWLPGWGKHQKCSVSNSIYRRRTVSMAWRSCDSPCFRRCLSFVLCDATEPAENFDFLLVRRVQWLPVLFELLTCAPHGFRTGINWTNRNAFSSSRIRAVYPSN